MRKISEVVEVNAPLDVCYQTWTDFENLPQRMRDVKSVQKGPCGHWIWTITGPYGKPYTWHAECTLHPGQAVIWYTVPEVIPPYQHHIGATDSDIGAPDVLHSGTVAFEKIDENHTRLFVTITFQPPASLFGEVGGYLLGLPDDLIQANLLDFKNSLEAQVGAIPVT